MVIASHISHLHTTCFSKITTFLPTHVKASANTNYVSAHGLLLHCYHLHRAPMTGQVVGQPAWGSKLNTLSVWEFHLVRVVKVVGLSSAPWSQLQQHKVGGRCKGICPAHCKTCALLTKVSIFFCAGWCYRVPGAQLGLQAGELMILLIIRIYSHVAGLIDVLTGSTFRVEIALKL